MRRNGLKLFQGKFRLHIRKKSLHQKGGQVLEKADEVYGEIIIPEVFKVYLDMALRDIVYW